jgi:NAD(P)H dehydrogenase (quinone)
MSKILITGATGYYGKATVDFLLKEGVVPNKISVLVRNENKATDLREKGVNIIVADYNDYASLVNAFKGIDKLLFVSGNDLVNRNRQHENVVKAAKEADVKTIIYTSLERKNETENSPIAAIADTHLKTEKWLAESGIPYTLLKNNVYMDVIPMLIGEKILETNTIFLPAGNGRASVALRSEMAEATANILTSGGHEGKEYSITNIETYSYRDIAGIISELTGKTINYVSPSAVEYKKALETAGVPAGYIEIFAAMASAQADGEYDVVGNDLEKLLGRRPTTMKEFLKTIYCAN